MEIDKLMRVFREKDMKKNPKMQKEKIEYLREQVRKGLEEVKRRRKGTEEEEKRMRMEVEGLEDELGECEGYSEWKSDWT